MHSIPIVLFAFFVLLIHVGVVKIILKQRDPQEFKAIKERVYSVCKKGSEESASVELNISGYRTGVHNEKLMLYI